MIVGDEVEVWIGSKTLGKYHVGIVREFIGGTPENGCLVQIEITDGTEFPVGMFKPGEPHLLGLHSGLIRKAGETIPAMVGQE